MENCTICKWQQNDVCCNGGSPLCADFVGKEKCCNEFELDLLKQAAEDNHIPRID